MDVGWEGGGVGIRGERGTGLACKMKSNFLNKKYEKGKKNYLFESSNLKCAILNVALENLTQH